MRQEHEDAKKAEEAKRRVDAEQHAKVMQGELHRIR